MNIFDAGSEVFDIFEMCILGDREAKCLIRKAASPVLEDCLSVDCVKMFDCDDREASLERMHKFCQRELVEREEVVSCHG